jgi:hypothetical protein
MPTGYEVGMYQDIGRIRKSLEQIADALAPKGIKISESQYTQICNIIDDAKIKGDQDTDIYADAIVLVLKEDQHG